MKEVPLTKREQGHPAMGHGQWWGRKARFWDMDFIEYASDEQLDFLQDSIEEAIDQIARDYNAPQLKDLIDDIEVCGSYAYGIQRWWSDFDIQLSAKDKKDQEEIERLIADKSSLVKTIGQDLAMKLKHNIEIHYSVCDNKTYNEIYSLRKRKLYNRKEGEKLSSNHQRKFDRNTMRYEIVPRTPPWCEGDYWDENGDEKWHN